MVFRLGYAFFYFYILDNLEQATRKLILAENTSDLNTEVENECHPSKRIRKPRRICSSSDEEPEEANFERPPKLRKFENKGRLYTKPITFIWDKSF